MKRTPSEATASSESGPEDARGWIARAFTHVEDVVMILVLVTSIRALKTRRIHARRL